ncbi:MAG: ATP-binding protein [Fimbriimonadales bacterium]
MPAALIAGHQGSSPVVNQEQIDALIARPSEALNVEIKTWIDPASAKDQAKIVKAALALYNRNGGHLVIGFDDRTLVPTKAPAGSDIRQSFRLDVIQGLVSRYAHGPFEVEVGFGNRDGQDHPVVVVPSGVRFANAAKADLVDGSAKLIKLGDVYFRSLNSNGTPSTTVARPEDWREIAEICFNNREADFGAFIRRHLLGASPETLRLLLSALSNIGPAPAAPRPCEQARQLLDDGEARFEAAVAERRAAEPDDLVPTDLGAWSAGIVIAGAIPPLVADQSFLRTVLASNPQYTGFPTWGDTRSSYHEKNRPVPRDDGWESLTSSMGAMFEVVDFWRLDPSGKFYLRRALEDDLSARQHGIRPLTVFDPALWAYRVAEAIATGLAIARALGCTPEVTTLAFAFRWTRLKDRQIAGWANPARFYIGKRVAHDDTAEECVEVPLETPPAAIAPYVEAATRRLFAKFDGMEMTPQVVEDIVRRMIERRM